DLLFARQSYVDPAAWYRFDAASKKATRSALYQTPAADFSDVEVVREFATSKDGAKIPVNIIERKGTRLDGSNPAVLYGYGGFSIRETPAFSARIRAPLDHGVTYAVSKLRGGSD